MTHCPPNLFRAGLDVGSTTAKLMILDQEGRPCFSLYQRHGSDIDATLSRMFGSARNAVGNINVTLCATGSAGMGIAQRASLLFVQEVVATGEVVKARFPDVRTVVDIGGEDSKMIFLAPGRPLDIRMNGSCAGGTGAFIDQMASLLDISLSHLNGLAREDAQIHPIASRCGVFAKTDVQNLVSQKIEIKDICASILRAVALQNINTLARGKQIASKVLFCGGPLTFLPALGQSFTQLLSLDPDQAIFPDKGEFLPAWGAALKASGRKLPLDQWPKKLARWSKPAATHHLAPLFDGQCPFDQWQAARQPMQIPMVEPPRAVPPFFLGIDAGSTTTKVMIIDGCNQVVFKDYRPNRGNPVASVRNALNRFFQKPVPKKGEIRLAAGLVTGYGEELIRAALGLKAGAVETLAHLRAAIECNPKVSFILDIGGQDMKAIFVRDQAIERIEINEACSSGCGSFIEGFARALSLTPGQFARMACQAKAPCDLGTRCTVFMNSRIKQAQKENASVQDISAGLAYAVIKNSLFKVLGLKDPKELGSHIVVQGGTFRNPGVVRALEKLTDKTVVSSEWPEMMGAFGAALMARDSYMKNPGTSCCPDLGALCRDPGAKVGHKTCQGCANHCRLTVYSFSRGSSFFTGNRCERVVTNQGRKPEPGKNLFALRHELAFDRNLPTRPGAPCIGMPRALELYENFPFWAALFQECGFNVAVSDRSSHALNRKGMGTVMADNICFPAKLAHSHLVDLADKQVDRILYPMVIHEPGMFPDAANSFNCPIVTGYGEVLKGLMDPVSKIPMDTPAITFSDPILLKKALRAYLSSLGIGAATCRRAVKKAIEAQNRFQKALHDRARALLAQRRPERPLIVLAGRPYHSDPMIEQKTSEILAGLGADVLGADLPACQSPSSLTRLNVLPQWAHSNQLLKAALWVAAQQDRTVQYVMLTSFGCGPDAFIMDEIRDILIKAGKLFTLIKIDEIESTSSVRLRLRSLIESIRQGASPKIRPRAAAKGKAPGQKAQPPIIAPFVSEFYSRFTPSVFALMGYEFNILPRPDRRSVELGLTYANNEVCYPATIIIGDIIKALTSGRYDPLNVAVAMTQTGGQCRASSYLPLIQKSLAKAGFADLPVVSMACDKNLGQEQPGFEFKMGQALKPAFASLFFADAIAKMTYAARPRQCRKGQARTLAHDYLEQACQLVAAGKLSRLFPLLEAGVRDFNAILATDAPLPRIALVGEIYLRYNRFAQMGITGWLNRQGIEVQVPVLADFAMQFFVNQEFNRSHFIAPRSAMGLCHALFEKLVNRWQHRCEAILEKFACPLVHTSIRDKAAMAAPIVGMGHQYGEGWLIAAEIADYAHQGIQDIVCVQPFGCISNHVIAKGVEHRIKQIYPEISLLFLDFDPHTSEVNVLNRLHFLAQSARARFC